MIPSPNEIPADLLRNLAASSLRVIDVTQLVVQVDALDSLIDLSAIGKPIGIDLPDLKPADVLHTTHDVSQRLSVIVFETQPAVGTACRSSLDDASSSVVHTNFNLFRETPPKGSATRAQLERVETSRALDRYREELSNAIAHLRARPAMPLDHPDLTPS